MSSGEFVERRQDANSQSTVLLLKALAEQVGELKTTVADLKRSSTYSQGITTEMIERAVKHAMADGFPDGDAIGHRQAHEQWLRERDERREMWAKVRSGLVEKAIWAVIIGIGILLVFYFGRAFPS